MFVERLRGLVTCDFSVILRIMFVGFCVLLFGGRIKNLVVVEVY